MLYGHGDDGYLQKKAIIANFSTNVYEAPEPLGLQAHLLQHWSVINHYPEVLAESLREKIAQYHQLNEGQVLVLNGAEEGIHLVAQMFRGSATSIATPTFSEYADACRIHGHALSFVPWEQMPDKYLCASLVFICNPNNPTGRTLSVCLIEHLLQKHPAAIFCIDEAFIDFTQTIDHHLPLLARYDNLIILKSLTKNFSIPGLRLGYLLASREIIQKMQTIKVAWSVNALAIEAGKYIFDQYDRLALPIEKMLAEKKQWLQNLKAIEGFEWYESDTHFFLGKVSQGTAASLKKYLVTQYQLLIRDAANFQGLEVGHFRVATLSPEKNQLLTEALQTWSQTQ